MQTLEVQKTRVSVRARAKAFLLRFMLQNITLFFSLLAISSLNDHTPSGSLRIAQPQ